MDNSVVIECRMQSNEILIRRYTKENWTTMDLSDVQPEESSNGGEFYVSTYPLILKLEF